MKFLAWLSKEGKALAVAFAYFLIYYSIFVLLKKLILLEYHISYIGFGVVILGALISAKTVLVIESTPLSKVLETEAPALKVIYDCLVYTVLALIFLYVEKVVEIAHKEGAFRLAFLDVVHEDNLGQFWAVVLWVALSFLGYAAFAAMSRQLGHGELIRMFFTAPRKRVDKQVRE